MLVDLAVLDNPVYGLFTFIVVCGVVDTCFYVGCFDLMMFCYCEL